MRRAGRPTLSREIRDLMLQMATDNSSWGAPRIHGELRMLGIEIAERTVPRYMPARPPDPESRQG
jgi:hypothetical protein